MDKSPPGILAFTMGDPAGIGPEVMLKAFFHRNRQGFPWLYVGDPLPLHRCSLRMGLNFQPHLVSKASDAKKVASDQLAVYPVKSMLDGNLLFPGQSDVSHAAVTIESIETACRLALEREVAAIVTPPINKRVLHQAGFHFPGHTEFLGELTQTPQPVMMLAGRGLRVVPATIHIGLNQVAATLTPQLLRHVITTTYQALQVDFGLDKPVLAVTGLNPHAGEDGAFGQEEVEMIQPLCEQLRKEGLAVHGPLSADSLFHPDSRKRFHAVVCMYHDQALIPIKMLAFGQAVNITLGLPIVRTSVDHGTAYDIAGQGIADHRSLLEAALVAETISRNRFFDPELESVKSKKRDRQKR
ncbi:MAG: 4-hydroxythreonine-4-phosphate dehydrogenase PdxA [Magnetococcales bacterium]|nr:4-hydroxythreonine-4-phosphate dehydrogenase PdxA [Magnetococcales bacterium]NGZ28298.1 4-hydroxythreonine-4-phosphate dehydrogenase PdxA [Magnetococcales bacterium]